MNEDWNRGDIDGKIATVSRLIEQALANIAVSNELSVEPLGKVRPGAIAWDRSTESHPFDMIQQPLYEAERLLNEIYDNRHETGVTLLNPYIGRLRERYGGALHDAAIEQIYCRMNASWSYVDVVKVTPLITSANTPFLFLVTLPLGKPHKGHKVVAEEHNRSGFHLHYMKLNGERSDILFAYGKNPPDPQNPIKWERHGSGKARFFPKPENWNASKRVNINEVCLAAQAKLPYGARLFTPSKEAQFLLPV